MPRGDRIKAQPRAAKQSKAERRQARANGPTKAERRQARAERKGAVSPTAAATPGYPEGDAAPLERIEQRLARLEAAVVTQAERSEVLLEKVEAILQESASR